MSYTNPNPFVALETRASDTYLHPMPRAVAGPEIERLIQLLARVPGLGPRSARRAALALVKRRDELMAPLAASLKDVAESVTQCGTCGNVDTSDPCTVCADPRRDRSTIIVVEEVGDLWALERAGANNALFHVLGGTLSPLDGVGPDDLTIAQLVDRVRSSAGSANGGTNGGDIEPVKEVILAVNATVEGQTTAHFITDQLGDTGARITRLAHGVPVGGELDYLDEGTLSAALRARTAF